jgi:hypothetical protein
VIVDNNDVRTTALSALVVNSDVYFFTLEQLDVKHSPLVGFEPRTDQHAILSANLHSLRGTNNNLLKVSNRVKLSLGHGPVLYLGTSVMLDEGGTLDVPSNLFIQNATLDWCGGVTSLDNVTVRAGGSIKVAYPAFTGTNLAHTGKVSIQNLTVDHGGDVTGSTMCDRDGKVVDLTVQRLEHMEGFTLEETDFSLIPGYVETILHPLNPSANCTVTVSSTNKAQIHNGQVPNIIQFDLNSVKTEMIK